MRSQKKAYITLLWTRLFYRKARIQESGKGDLKRYVKHEVFCYSVERSVYDFCVGGPIAHAEST